MQRIKKPFIWLLLLALVVSLTPTGLATPKVSAAGGLSSTTYFSPDILDIRKTASYTTEYTTDPSVTQIKRDNVYNVSTPTLDITGTFSMVAENSMSVKIEQLNSSTNSLGEVSWVTDSTHYATGTVTVDQTDTSGKKFIARDLTLFPGFNKITFTGKQGELLRSESFYVLYDKVPYLETLKALGGGLSAGITLNEGTPVVVKSSPISLTGIAQNATKISVSVNNGTTTEASMDSTTGNFFTSGLNLKPGINNLKLVIKNASDSVTIERSIFMYDANSPITGLYFYDGTKAYDIMNGNTPTVTTGGLTTGSLIAQVLIPYDTSDKTFAGEPANVTIDGTNTNFSIYKMNPFNADGTLVASPNGDEVTIPGPDGATPQYRLVTFRTDNYTLESSGGATASVQTPKIGISYGSGAKLFTAAYEGKFNYLPGQTLIDSLYYLPNYKETDDLTKVSQVPLNGASVDAATFYIKVKATAPISGATLQADYLPLGTKTLQITQVASPIGAQSTEQVYKITNFSNGQQNVRFYFNSQSYREVKINYVSKNYIYIDNIYDGQTYTFNSKKNDNTLTVTGKYIGFENIANAQYFVNGIAGDTLVSGTDFDPLNTKFTISLTDPTFKLALKIKASGPLVYGENRITFTGTSKDASGNSRLVQKEIRIYIIDTNNSTIDQFHPAIGKDRINLPSSALYSSNVDADKQAVASDLTKILGVSPLFTYKQTEDKYVTSETKYDLVMRGGGATILNFYRGSERLFTKPLSTTVTDTLGATDNYFTMDGVKYYYDFVGNQDNFVLRIRDLVFEEPGSHHFNLELVNDTGARTNKPIEIERQVVPYRLLAPQPTVGKQIVVNKNFVHFDIEAEGATKVLVGKFEATKRQDLKDRFVYDYVGLKPDKQNAIKIQIVRAGTTLNDTIQVYYTGTVGVNSEFMAEKVSNKYTVFNSGLQLSFPKGTILESANPGLNVTQFYPDNKLLFGIADPKDGVVERRDDYGNYVGRAQTELESGLPEIGIPEDVSIRFGLNTNTDNFARVSNIYWIHGGLGELNQGNVYKAGTNGIAPHSLEGYFTQFEAARKLVPSKRGTLTLTYNPNTVVEAGTTVTVFRFTDNGMWQNVGGEVNASKHTITVPFDDFGYYKVMKLRRSYDDITNHGWARTILNALYSKGIMPNLRTDAFGTDDITTRGEFATLLVKGLNLPMNYDPNEQSFFDVTYGATSGTWSFEYIETAARAGIVNGQTEGFFAPDAPVTREQAAVMIARAMNLKLATNDSKLEAALAKSFVDSGSMSIYSRPAVQAVTKAKIMTGSPTTVQGQKKPTYSFNPTGKLSRAEAGKIAVELLKKSTKMFPKNLS